MSTRKPDVGWLHCTEEGDANRKRAKCNYCSKLVVGITRLKQHLAKVGTDVTGCPNVSTTLSHQMLQSLVESYPPYSRKNSIHRGQSSDQQASALPQIKIAYKGIIGACSEEAAFTVCPHCHPDPWETFKKALQAVETLGADKAIIPIENSLGGSFYQNYDLINSHQLHIVGEVEVSTNFCLLARRGVRLEQLKRVLGYPQALEQTKTFLHNLGVEKETVDDDDPYFERLILPFKKDGLVIGTAQEHTGVIGSAEAADLHGLHVVASGIQDENEKSITRFWILARDPIVPMSTSFKTSLVFTLRKSPKDVYKALSVFSTTGIMLTKVVSRPQKSILPNVVDSSTEETADERFDYLFYVDFEASMVEAHECAVRQLKDYATSVRILGSYPAP